MARKRNSEPTELLIVNDVPGEECRIAIVQDGHLEELYSERTATATSVGNIYVGRVTNVESAIQAAFVDFGEGQNGFLHVSDLHPKHFPGAGRTEKVGRKIPRRERPAIQECLKRGQEILVQVLKEGIGTKGPTLTSYLSIPGRLLVAMPYMDKVGVSRKVEDDEKRREMRKVLDEVELPDGFGFILRTAGMGRSKTDIKRDVAYLMRLWKAMEKRRKTESAPCELYTESDLLIRTIRDVLRPSISAIIVDSEMGYNRAENFVRVVMPRSAPKVLRYTRPGPIFHAFDVERQIDLIHSREVPLRSGGSIVIEQTEALVAIDVNSGRSLRARDSETNAYETNCEAADEICRQLRLRDLGGLVINDLIDMRSANNRRRIEERVRENLKRDRARATALRISEFGILEMTRQRMRPSMRKAHFITCPHCDGHGEIMSPESVAMNAVRQIGYLIQYPQIVRVELVCSPRVASIMLSAKRRALVRLEDESDKKVDVRVSDALAADRVDFYCYDDRNADVDVTKLKPLVIPSLDVLEKEHRKYESTSGSSHSRRTQAVELDDFDDEVPDEEVGMPLAEASATASDSAPVKKKRRRRRRKAGDTPIAESASAGDATSGAQKEDGEDADSHSLAEPQAPEQRRKKRRRRGRRPISDEAAAIATKVAVPRDDLPNEPSTNAIIVDDEARSQTIRVHVLAKEIGVPSREVILRADDDDDIDLKNHMSTVTQDQAEVIRDWFNRDTTEAARRNEGEVDQSGDQARSRRRRSRRRSRRKDDSVVPTADRSGHDEATVLSDTNADGEGDSIAAATNDAPAKESTGDQRRSKKRRSRRRGKSPARDDAAATSSSRNGQSQPPPKSGSAKAIEEPTDTRDATPTDASAGRKGRRRRKSEDTTSRSKESKGADGSQSTVLVTKASGVKTAEQTDGEATKLRKPRRTVYAGRRRLKVGERPPTEDME